MLQLGKSLIPLRVKEQDIVSKCSAEAEYKSIAMTCSEILWLLVLLQDLGFTKQEFLLVGLLCDNQATLLARIICFINELNTKRSIANM